MNNSTIPAGGTGKAPAAPSQFKHFETMKTLLSHIRIVVVIVAASQLATAASLIHFAPVSEWPNTVWPVSKPGSSLALAGDYAYVAGDDGILRISDVSNPTNPVAISTLTFTNNQRPSEILVSGHH